MLKELIKKLIIALDRNTESANRCADLTEKHFNPSVEEDNVLKDKS